MKNKKVKLNDIPNYKLFGIGMIGVDPNNNSVVLNYKTYNVLELGACVINRLKKYAASPYTIHGDTVRHLLMKNKLYINKSKRN